jgi:predicted nucleic acid-binding protein
MHTTLDIDDDLLVAAKELARRENLTAGQIVSRLLREALTGVRTASAGRREGPRRTAAIDWSRLLSARHLTDAYLLALAVEHRARLVTLDESVPISAVKGAKDKHLVVVA